jgi:hypothetical protein
MQQSFFSPFLVPFLFIWRCFYALVPRSPFQFLYPKVNLTHCGLPTIKTTETKYRADSDNSNEATSVGASGLWCFGSKLLSEPAQCSDPKTTFVTITAVGIYPTGVCRLTTSCGQTTMVRSVVYSFPSVRPTILHPLDTTFSPFFFTRRKGNPPSQSPSQQEKSQSTHLFPRFRKKTLASQKKKDSRTKTMKTNIIVLLCLLAQAHAYCGTPSTCIDFTDPLCQPGKGNNCTHVWIERGENPCMSKNLVCRDGSCVSFNSTIYFSTKPSLSCQFFV